MRAIGMESDYDENRGNCKCLSGAYGPQLCKIGKLIKKMFLFCWFSKRKGTSDNDGARIKTTHIWLAHAWKHPYMDIFINKYNDHSTTYPQKMAFN